MHNVDISLKLGLSLLTVLDDRKESPGKSLEADWSLLGWNFLEQVDMGFELIRAEVRDELVHVWLVGQDGLEFFLPRLLDGTKAIALLWELFLELSDDRSDVLQGFCYLGNQHFLLN